MANEITISATLKYAKAKASASLATSYSASQVGDKYMAGVQAIGTAEESLIKGDIGNIGYLAIRNMDATNYCELGATAANYSLLIKPGEGTVVPWSYATTFIKAHTAGVEVEYLLIEA